MSISVTCQNCEKSLKAPDKAAGKRVRCRACQAIIQVPGAESPWDDDPVSPPRSPRGTSPREPSPGASRGEEKPSGTRAPKPAAETEFDWSQPLEPAPARREEDEFANVENLPSLPAAPRKKVRQPDSVEVGFAAPLGSEGPQRRISRKTKSRSAASQDLPPEGGAGYWHWLLALALLPLAISIFMPTAPITERLEAAFAEHPEVPIAFYLGIATILHGLYDTLLKQELDLAALAVAAASFGWWAWLLSRQSGHDENLA